MGHLTRACTCAEAGRCSPHSSASSPETGRARSELRPGVTGRHRAATSWSPLLREGNPCHSVWSYPWDVLVLYLSVSDTLSTFQGFQHLRAVGEEGPLAL